MPKGGKREGAGRKPGISNRLTQEWREGLSPLISKATTTAQQILDLTLPCSVCRGVGKTKFQPSKGARPGIRPCMSCWGSGKEKITPELRARIAIELLNYGHPKLQAVEHTGDGGGAVSIVAQIIEARVRRMKELEGADDSSIPSGD